MLSARQSVFRFAPSPTGRLHLGHAYSALLNEKLAREAGGRLLLRIEDQDHTRATPENRQGIIADMAWLGINFEKDIRRQSENTRDYELALSRLEAMGVLFRCRCQRSDFRQKAYIDRDPEGKPLYPGTCKSLKLDNNERLALRLDMTKALTLGNELLSMIEKSEVLAISASAWGDVILARKDTGLSYHLCVVVDDAIQGVTDIVRGEELLAATAVHRLLQVLLEFPEPHYHHHALIRDEAGRKLSKSDHATALADLRASGVTADDIRKRLGFSG